MKKLFAAASFAALSLAASNASAGDFGGHFTTWQKGVNRVKCVDIAWTKSADNVLFLTTDTGLSAKIIGEHGVTTPPMLIAVEACARIDSAGGGNWKKPDLLVSVDDINKRIPVVIAIDYAPSSPDRWSPGNNTGAAANAWSQQGAGWTGWSGLQHLPNGGININNTNSNSNSNTNTNGGGTAGHPIILAPVPGSGGIDIHNSNSSSNTNNNTNTSSSSATATGGSATATGTGGAGGSAAAGATATGTGGNGGAGGNGGNGGNGKPPKQD